MEQHGRSRKDPGRCLRAMICMLIALSLWLVLPLIPRKDGDPEAVMNGAVSGKKEHMLGPRPVRETANDFISNLSESWMDHPNPPHPFATNMWWRLMNHTAKEYGSHNCYVCAQFTHSTIGQDLWPDQDHNTSTIMAVVAVAAAGCVENSTLFYNLEGDWGKMKVTKRVFGKVATVRDMQSNLTCYSRVKGSNPLGKIPKSRCKVIHNGNDINESTQQRCLVCLDTDVWLKHMLLQGVLTQSTIAVQYLAQNHYTRTRCKDACAHVSVPDEDGTGVVDNMYWQCGYAVYVSLPRNWTGTCALVQLYGGTVILHQQQLQFMTRKKRGLFKFLQNSPVPKTQHIRSVAQRVLSFFASIVAVESPMEELEVTRYELISFVNTTKIMMEDIREELRELRLTALQNRIVLDEVLASRGGVCAIVGETCCTYIPENDEDGHVISEAIKNLTLMSKTLTDRETNSGCFGWGCFTGLFSNATSVMTMVMCAFCSGLFILCLWPYVMSFIRKTVSSTLQKQAHAPKPVYNRPMTRRGCCTPPSLPPRNVSQMSKPSPCNPQKPSTPQNDTFAQEASAPPSRKACQLCV